MKILYEANIPIEFKGVLEPYLNFLPSWVRELDIFYDEKNTTGYMCSSGQVKYRRISLVFCPAYLTLTQDEREQTILHEMAHAYSLATHELILDRLMPRLEELSKAESEVWKKWFIEVNETMVEDLAVLFQDSKYKGY